MKIRYWFCINIENSPILLIYSFFPCVLPDMGGMGGWSDKSFLDSTNKISNIFTSYQTHNIFHVERMDIFIFCICIIENSISNISSQFVHFCKAISPGWWWAHGKYFTKLEVASPAHPPCGLRAHGRILLSLKRHRTWLIMVLGIWTHGVCF